MKKMFIAAMLLFSMNAAQALTYDQQKLLYLTMHSSIMLMHCGYPDASWELVDAAKTFGDLSGYTAPQQAQLHNKINSRITYIIQLQGGLRETDCDNAVNFHAYVMNATKQSNTETPR